jgi:CRP-like cAMP-binding protein
MSPLPSATSQLAEEDKAKITKKLFLEIQSAVKERNIAHAEGLREKLMALNPMALTEIIKSAELIEEIKNAGIDKDHLAIWDKLYGMLSTEEKNCLYYSLKKVVVPPGKVILAQGGFNTRLFLIDSGRVTIYLPKGDKHIVVAQLGRGDILGEYTFTTISLCSATAVSHTEVQMMYLESAAADSWEHKQPGLYDKLVDFCIRCGRVDEIIRRKKLEKRTSVRYSIEGRIVATVLTKEGKKTETYFRGSLSDISATGTCFLIKCSKRTTARAFLARHLLLSISFERGDEKVTFSVVGKVVGVSFHLYNDYSVHVHFVKQLREDQIQKAAFQGI